MSKKNTFYFSHDYNARTDAKIKKLISIHGMLGYGVYWSIIEDLYNNANALLLDYDVIAYDLRVSSEVVHEVVNSFDLFDIDGDFFKSASVQRRLDERKLKSEKAKESASYRWGKPEKKQTQSKKDANAYQTESDSNANKGKERKVNSNIVPQSETSLLIDLEYSEDLHQYQKVALAFFNLIRKNLKDNGQVNFTKFDKSKVDNWVKVIKLMYEVDKRTQEEFYKVYDFLELQTESAIFWRKTIESMNSLRKHFDKLIIQSNSTGTKKPYKKTNSLNI